MAFTTPTVADFQAQFPRDFPYAVNPVSGQGDDSNLGLVTTDDINGAIQDAQFNINPGLFANQASYTRAFCYLAAHQLCEKLLMGAAGAQSQYSWLTTSKSVADVSESFEVPEMVRESPILAHFSKTRYGAMYVQIVAPLLVGNVGALPRVTIP